jgi:quercetin dioxygenase-like cupin family protein
MRHAFAVGLTIASLTACAGDSTPDAAKAGDSAAAAAAPATAEPMTSVFSNEYATASVVTLAPGQVLPAHNGGPRAIYSLSDYTIRFTQGGQTTEPSWKTGQAHFHEAGEHAIENIGTTEAKFLVVARTAQALAPAPTHSDSPAGSAAGATQKLLDNADVLVTEVRLPAGDTLPRHHGMARVVYSLSDYTISYTSNTAEPVVKSFTVGQAHWHDADEHLIVNTGTTEAHFVIVQLRR